MVPKKFWSRLGPSSGRVLQKCLLFSIIFIECNLSLHEITPVFQSVVPLVSRWIMQSKMYIFGQHFFIKAYLVSIPASSLLCISLHWWVAIQWSSRPIDDYIYIYVYVCIYIYIYIYIERERERERVLEVQSLKFWTVTSEFHSLYNVNFRANTLGKVMNPLIR